MLFYLIPFLVACLGVIGLLYFLVRWAPFVQYFTSPHHHRHMGGRGLFRVGGIAVGIVFFCVMLLDGAFVIDEKTLILFVLAGTLLVFGIFDDIWRLSWRIQLTVQSIAALGLALYGMGITHVSTLFGGSISFVDGHSVLIGIVMTILWVVMVINALNWSDGMHGIFGGIGVITTLTIAVLALRPDVYQPPVALMGVVLAGAMSGFALCNMMGKRVIVGTSGTFFFGFMVAALAIFAGVKIGTALLVLIVPLMDALYVVQNRIRHGAKVVAPDMTHLHHRLSAKGWSHKKILIVYYALTLVGAGCALLTQSVQKMLIFFLYGGILFVAFFLFTKTSSHHA